MMKDHYCWFCHRICQHKLNCNKCGRNFHLKCVSDYKPRLLDVNGLKKFESVCPECISLDRDAKKWVKGEDFEPVPKKTLNTLLKCILDSLKPEAPDPFLWPLTKFQACANPIDVSEIGKRAENNSYNSPRAFLHDIYLIIHNCLVIFRYSTRLNVDKSILRQMADFDKLATAFRRAVDTKIRFLEDCPYCIWNYRRDAENWLTNPCPWGHPLVIVDIDTERKFVPAKLIKFNRASGRVDIILFAFGERVRVSADECWVPRLSDLIPDRKDNERLAEAKSQAKQYLESIEKKFKIKMNYGKERRKLTARDKDYIKKNSIPDIIELTDDESIVGGVINNPSVTPNEIQLEINEETSSKHSDENSNGEVTIDINNNDDEIIDEIVNEISETNETNTVINTVGPSPLTTLIERIPSPAPSPSPTPASATVTATAPTRAPTPAPATVTTNQPETVDNLDQVSNPKSTPIKISNPTNAVPLKPNEPSTSTSTSSVFTTSSTSTPPPSMNENQFDIVSDEDETQTSEPDHEPEPEPEPIDNEKKSNAALPSPQFIIEDDHDSNCVPQFQPISPFRLTLNEDGANNFFELETMKHKLSNGSTDFRQSKKMKLDEDIVNTSHLFEMKRLEQQLEFAEKEKQLNRQQISEIQEQLRLTKQMAETKLKTTEIQYQSQIKILKDTIEEEKRAKEILNSKLVKAIEQSVNLVQQVDATKSFWENKLTEESKSRNEQHKREMDSKIEEINTLNEKLNQIEEKYKKLENEHNTILPKYKRLSTTITSLRLDCGDFNDESPEKTN